MPIRVIIADDHAIVREGIKALFEKLGREIAVCGEASNGRELLEVARKKPADVYVVDIAMPGLNGLEAASRLLSVNKQAKIICLSMYNDNSTVQKAMGTGARGYVLKENTGEDMVKAIRAVNRGGYYMGSSLPEFVPGNRAAGSGSDKLTPKEREIVQLIAEGCADKEISRKLKISINTVHAHRNNISRKLDIHKQTDLVRFAIKEKIAAV